MTEIVLQDDEVVVKKADLKHVLIDLELNGHVGHATYRLREALGEDT